MSMTREDAIKIIAEKTEQAKTRPDGDKYFCPICEDERGFLFDIEDSCGVWFECKCVKKRTAITRMNNSGINEADRNKTIDDYKTLDNNSLIRAKNTVIDYMDKFNDAKRQQLRNNSLLLMGRSGSGKTMLGIIASMHIINNCNTELQYKPYRDIVTVMKRYMMDDTVYNQKMREVTKPQILFIDDLFKGKVTESDISIMYDVINMRYLENKHMIISTEQNIESLMDIDEAIASRIIEMSKGHIVMFGNDVDNYRLRM